MGKPESVVLAAFGMTLTILALGYVSFGGWTTLVFAFGFLGGFILWFLAPAKPPFSAIQLPYVLAMVLFVLHRVEERVSGFFPTLAEVTGVSVPSITSLPIVLLVIASVGGWLLSPILVSRGYAFGYYLVWTFFAAMGITELAHFIFPLFADRPYGYFPGMGSVIALAPTAWWGMWRLWRG